MKPTPKEAMRRTKMLLARNGGKCRACGASEWDINEYGDIGCAPCWRRTCAAREAEIKKRMK